MALAKKYDFIPCKGTVSLQIHMVVVLLLSNHEGVLQPPIYLVELWEVAFPGERLTLLSGRRSRQR
jgi:hypothetical protein